MLAFYENENEMVYTSHSVTNSKVTTINYAKETSTAIVIPINTNLFFSWNFTDYQQNVWTTFKITPHKLQFSSLRHEFILNF